MMANQKHAAQCAKNAYCALRTCATSQVINMEKVMSLLQEIQAESIDELVSLATTLRKCKVLAYKLGLDEFKQWVEYELNGYENSDELPNYRVIRCQSKGDFINHAYRHTGAEIPSGLIPEEYRDITEIVQFKESIAVLQFLCTTEKSTLARPWNANLTALIGSKISQNTRCLKAWTEIPTTSVKDILENVRNRILTFSLEIEQVNPNADSIQSVTVQVKEKMQQIYNTTIHGDVQNFAQSAENITQNAEFYKNENTELFTNLKAEIQKCHLQQNVLDELYNLLDAMQNTQKTPAFSEKYKRFMSLLSDHMQVIGTFIPQLSTLIS